MVGLDDRRAGVQKAAAGATDRVAAAWFSPTGFTVDVNLTDGQAHKVSLYSVDWDGSARSQLVEVIDPTTGNVIDSRKLSSFHNGVYLSFTISGHVTFRITRLAGANAVLSGLFLDPS